MDVAFELTPLAAAKLIAYSFGALIYLFLMTLILGQRRLRRFEWLLFALMAALFMWNSGNLLALNLSLAYGVAPAIHERFARLIPFLGAILCAPLVVHVHSEYAFPLPVGAGRVAVARFPKRLLIALFYLPLVGAPWLVGRLLGRIELDPLVALRPFVRPLVMWTVLALGVAAAINVRLWQVSRHLRPARFHAWLAGIEAFLAAGFAWTYLARSLPSFPQGGLGGYFPTLLMLLAVAPGGLVGYSIFRYNFFDLRVQRNLIYSLVAIFALLIYLNFIRRVSEFLEHILPSVVTEGVMIFILVVFLEPVKKRINRALERVFASEFERVQKLSAEIQDFAKRSGELDALRQFVEERLPADMGLERVKLGFGNSSIQARRPSGRPGKVRTFAVRRGDEVVGVQAVDLQDHQPAVLADPLAEAWVFFQQLHQRLHRAQRILHVVGDARRHFPQEGHLRFLRQLALELHFVSDELAKLDGCGQLVGQEPEGGELLARKLRPRWCHLEDADDLAASADRPKAVLARRAGRISNRGRSLPEP